MKQPIALVLSGGAARGLAHIGVIEELEKRNFEITSIAGNSMGAFVGAIYAAGNLVKFKEWILNLNKKDLVKFVDLTVSGKGFIKGKRLFETLEPFLPDMNIEDLRLPYVAVASDITNRREVIFDSGSLKQAVRASISIPAIFKPVIIDEAMLIDGGFVNPIPLNRVLRTEGDLLVGSFVNADVPTPELDQILSSNAKKAPSTKRKLRLQKQKSPRLLSIMNDSTNLVTYSLAMANIEKYKPDMLINISRHSCGNFHFHKIEEMVAYGRQAVVDCV